MGNKQSEQTNQAHTLGQKIVLKLRYRDIILHYSFKMKVTIADIGLFPDHLEGLRLWDSDIVLSRFIILENELFKNKDVMVFKAGVGIAGVTLSKWAGCKKITMCDTRKEVVENIRRNCDRNAITDVTNLLINLNELNNFKDTYDLVLTTDLFGEGFANQSIIYIWRKLLKVGGEAIMIVPDKKEESKKLLELIDREEFTINNLVLTAEEYETSPLFNKLESQSEFPLLGKSTFYAICLKKKKEVNISKEKESDESEQRKKQVVQQSKEIEKKENKQIEKKVIVNEDKKENIENASLQQPQPFSNEDKEEERNQKLAKENKVKDLKQAEAEPEIPKDQTQNKGETEKQADKVEQEERQKSLPEQQLQKAQT